MLLCATDSIPNLNHVQGDLLLLACGKSSVVNKALDRVRQYLGKSLKLIDETQRAMLWVTDFPMYEYNEEEDRLEVSKSGSHISV